MNGEASTGVARRRPGVSVVMNCHNCGRYLGAAVRSVLAQSFGDYEVVFWDNCSDDDSATVFKSFRDRRLKYFRGSSLAPLGEARNLAAAEAEGEWLAFLDCDDVWMPTKLERQMAEARREGVDLVYGYTEVLVEDDATGTELARAPYLANPLHVGYRPGGLPSGDIFRRLLRNNFIPLSSLCVRRTAFERVGGFDRSMRYAEDYDLVLRVASTGLAAAVQSSCCAYRLHGGNATHGAIPEATRETLTALSRHARDGGRFLPTVRAQLRRHRARLVLHEIRRGDPTRVVRLLSPSLWWAFLTLLTRQLGLRVARWSRWSTRHT